MAKSYWLLKTEPESYSIQDLAAEADQTTAWDGVRNYQARNLLRDRMRPGDQAFLYHSSTEPPGIVGVGRVVSDPYPDATALNPKSVYYDEKSTSDTPRWFVVDIQLEKIFPQMLKLETLRTIRELAGMELLRRGSRLSVQPVTASEFRTIMAMAKKRAAE